MDNTKDAFIWLKDNYSSLTESEYTELADKWGKLKVYCPIVADEESLYELNELSYINGEWSFEVLGTESDESKLNGDYPIVSKSETTKNDDDWTKWASYMETQVTESGAVKDETVCEPNGAEVVELTEEEIAKLNGTTEESTDDGISEETVEDSSEITEESTVDEVTDTTEEVTESVEENSDDITDEVSESAEESTIDEVDKNTDTVEVDNVVEETAEKESSDVVKDNSDVDSSDVDSSDKVVDTTEQENTEITDEGSIEESTDESEENTDIVESNFEETTETEESNLEENTENITN